MQARPRPRARLAGGPYQVLCYRCPCGYSKRLRTAFDAPSVRAVMLERFNRWRRESR